MKFKISDEVRVVADEKRLGECFVERTISGKTGTIVGIGIDGWHSSLHSYSVKGDNWVLFLPEDGLELVELVEPERTFVSHADGGLEVKDTSIRTFDTGATRDTVQGKLSYVRILSPIVLRRYVEYMNFHAKQSDGTMREPDNWKSGFPIETYLDSLGRHLVAVWLLQQDFTETDNHGSVTLEDSLCGIIFNAMGWLHEILKTKLPPNKVELDYQAAVEHETGALETVPGYGGDVDAR